MLAAAPAVAAADVSTAVLSTTVLQTVVLFAGSFVYTESVPPAGSAHSIGSKAEEGPVGRISVNTFGYCSH